ncbi:MAG: hydrogenase large subunit [Fimbriimonadaceae bacterium]
MIRIASQQVDLAVWQPAVAEFVRRKEFRYGHLTARRAGDGSRRIELLLLHPSTGSAQILAASIAKTDSEFPSITSEAPAAHWAERAVGDLWGLRAVGHPRWRSLVLHPDLEPHTPPCAKPGDGQSVHIESPFLTVGGDGVHVIPVGPIHAGIIEPGHFRFSCLGEIIANLEMRLGYQHRGIEARVAEVPWQRARHVIESASSDSTVAHALAHATALESLLDIEAPRRASTLRTLALEIERIANHLGDLGALASDVGFALGAATFGRLRGGALGLGQILAGTRFQKGFVCVGGVAWNAHDAKLVELTHTLASLKPAATEACKLLFDNAGFEERLEGVGVLNPSLAAEFGVVGPSARACGNAYDARRHFKHAEYPARVVAVAGASAGDALARASVRRQEIEASWTVLEALLDDLPEGPPSVSVPNSLPADRVSIGVVEAWRGELIHWLTTGSSGNIARYAIRDPSFQNWTGVAIAVRNNLLADFPLINKSFNLSYSGNDL